MGMDARTTAEGAVDWLRWRSARAVLRIAACTAVAMLVAGCQADPNMQLAERELRLQDSHIFELEEHLADCHSTVDEYRREIAALRRQVDEKAPSAPAVEDNYEDNYYDDWDPDSRLRPPRPGGPSLPDIDEGDEMSSPPLGKSDEADLPEAMPLPAADEPPAPIPASRGEGASFQRRGGHAEIRASGTTDEELPRSDWSHAADEVEQIGLRLLVRYHAAEDTSVELQTLIEPQDADAEQVLSEGDVSLMIVTADGGPQKPLARWDFAEEEARAHWKRSRLGTGMLFELPWPGTPQPGKYRLWARMLGRDGRKHLSSADFEVQEEALAAGPPTHAPVKLVLPGPGLAPEPEPDTAEEPEPFPHSSSEPERLGATESAAPVASPEPRVASTASIAWKASVEAARLPRLPKPQRPPATPNDVSSPHAGDDGRLIPWSPERPDSSTSAGSTRTADGADAWSPYR